MSYKYKHWLKNDLNFTSKIWWGNPYHFLNSMPDQSQAALWDIQKKAFAENNMKLSNEINQLNEFLNQVRNAYAKKTKGRYGEEDFFEIFTKKINEGYDLITNPKTGIKPNVSNYKIDSYERQILQFLKFLAERGGQEIPLSLIKDLKTITERIKDDNYYSFRRRKAQFFEDVGTWILSLSGFNAIGTGKIIDRLGQQLVQDSVAYLGKDINNKSVQHGIFQVRITGTSSQEKNLKLLEELSKNIYEEIKFAPGGKGYIQVQTNRTFKGFTDLIEHTSNSMNEKITIKIEDSLSEEISNQFLTLQSKSGSAQDLLNNSKRDLIKSSDLVLWDEYLKILSSFYFQYKSHPHVSEGDSQKLSAYANYVFSKNIAKTVLSKNTFFFSHYGFDTLDNYMKKNNFYFKLSPSPRNLTQLLNNNNFTIQETKI